MRKSALAIFVIFAIMLCFNVVVSAEYDGYYEYIVEDGKATIVSFDSAASGNIMIPSTLGNYPVTAIGDESFWSCSGITSVTVPDGITHIGEGAFAWCDNLENITISDSLTGMGDGIFVGCYSLKNIAIPNGVTYIGEEMFLDCKSLTEVRILGDVTYIGDYAFEGCNNLVNVNLPDSLTYIGDGAFFECYALKSITLPKSITRIGSDTFYECRALADVTIMGDVTYIGACAFDGCESLTGISIPKSVKTIGMHAFDRCAELKRVDIADLSAWCNMAFDNFSSNPLLYAHDLYVNGELITELIIPENVTNIRNYAFVSCYKLASITVHSSVVNIDDYAFLGCVELNNIIVDEDNKYFKAVDGVLFDYEKSILKKYPAKKNGTSYIIPYGVKRIGQYAFTCCENLENIIIPDTVTSIYFHAFDACLNLKSIKIPASVTAIDAAFAGCTGMTDIRVYSDDYAINPSMFAGTSATLYGNANSTTQVYAKENGLPFRLLTTVDEGEGNVDFVIDADETKCVKVAIYDSEGNMLDCVAASMMYESEMMCAKLRDNESAAYAKVFVWESEETMKPTISVETVEIERT